LIDVNTAGTDSAAVGALFPSISADGRYEVFESGSFEGTSLPAPSDLVNGLTVENDAPNIYLRDRLTNTTTCLSVNMTGHETGNDDSRYPVLSANGQYVVFLSNATDLVPLDNDSNNPDHRQNVFVRDLLTNATTLVSVNYEGTGPGTNSDMSDFGTSRNPSISAGGRFVAYESDAVDLVSNDANGLTDVFVRDLQTSTTILVSANVRGGGGSGDGSSNNPVISTDGSTVAFDSLANNLDPNYTGLAPFSNYEVYAFNIQAKTASLVSIDPTGAIAGNDGSGFSSVSQNGQVIAFQSNATNLVTTTDANGGSPDIFVRNLATDKTQLVSINDSGSASGDSSSFAPDISADGNHVVFSSLANDLVSNDNDGTDYSSKDVFERNLLTNTTQLISVNTSGTNSGNDTSDMPNQTFVNSVQQSSGVVSSDGRYVIFMSLATDLVPGFVKLNDPTYGFDLYLRDTVAGTTTLISHQLGTSTTGGDQISGTAGMTPDGGTIAFQSTAGNLVANDTNNQTDVFVSPADYVPVGPGTLQLDAAGYSVGEYGGSVTVHVSRTAGSTGAVSVKFSTSGGTAVAGVDYTDSTQTLNWASGDSSSKTITIPILVDPSGTGTKTVSLSLGTPTGGAALGAQSTAILSIQDTLAVIQFASATFTANVLDGVVHVVLTRTQDLPASVSVVVSSPGGNDVAGFHDTITFAANATSATDPIPIQNDGQPGEGDVSIPISLSSPSAGATLGTAGSASLIVHDNNPYPAPVMVSSVSTPTMTIKVGSGKKAKSKKETVLQIQFSGTIVAGVLNLNAYTVKSGKTKKSVTTYNKNVRLSSVSYNSTSHVVTIYPASSLNLSLPEQLQITSALLTDAYGRALDGNHDGQPGGNFVATFSKKGDKIQ